MRQNLLLSIFFLTFLTVCQGQSNDNSSTTRMSNLNNFTPFVPIDSSQFYFPLETFHDTSIYIGHDNFANTWYSKHLFAMKEPVIFMDNSENEIYRFTWLRTFHNPVAIRIEKQGDSCLLYWKSCSGAGGYQPGKLTVNSQKIIEKATWNEFKSRLDQIDFWNLKTNEKVFGCDGARWILEGKSLQQYHVVDRWTPDDNSKYYQCCDFLIGLTDLKIKNKYKY